MKNWEGIIGGNNIILKKDEKQILTFLGTKYYCHNTLM